MTENLRIAVADDEPDMREYFERMLPRMGHQVVRSPRRVRNWSNIAWPSSQIW
jgi:CheY-like chemotaxis protein